MSKRKKEQQPRLARLVMSQYEKGSVELYDAGTGKVIFNVTPAQLLKLKADQKELRRLKRAIKAAPKAWALVGDAAIPRLFTEAEARAHHRAEFCRVAILEGPNEEA